MKMHIGVDEVLGIIHSADNSHDVTMGKKRGFGVMWATPALRIEKNSKTGKLNEI
ncbi:hypothetical protein [Microbulbifer spongiae]|uniref:Uncharacterized protein n=1 Tax=Microbulbifer spongiae TaxID=2944933 RepID=A0ABY9E8A2_9GAMM|nr:hypothetical protein [Microbulbifer sp. MI-G]WKD48551.1 hypothetical protein M8T91_11525 [Microbulbifer sp. MI-G]